MIIGCAHCHTQFKVDPRRVNKTNFRARCFKCGKVFDAYQPVRAQEIHFIDLNAARKKVSGEKIIAVSNQKGGVGKTTTCLNLGAALARLGHRVLLVDFDTQANLTLSVGANGQKSLYEIIESGDRRLSRFLVETKYHNLWVLPANNNLVLLNKKHFGADNFEYLLKDRLNLIKDRFDVILIDTPPSIELLTLNALTAASLVVIPSLPDYLSTQGITQIVKMINLTQQKTNPGIRAKVLVNMYNAQSTTSRVILAKLNKMFSGMLLKTVLTEDSKIRESQILSTPVIHYDPKCPAARDYVRLAEEVMIELDTMSRQATAAASI